MWRIAPMLLLVTGCSYIFPDPHRVEPAPPDRTVVIDNRPRESCPALPASKRLAADRAESWALIAKGIRSGEIRTMSDMASRSLTSDRAAADRFNSTVQDWLESQLQGADDVLPDNAADVADRIASDFARAAK